MADLSVQALVDAGAHIGCRVSRWNPRMEPYIYGARNRIHIIDLRQTIRGILRARHFLRELVGSGEDVLFVGTKPQVQEEIRKVHERTGMPYVDDRWIGGTLTNYQVIGSRIHFLEEMEKKEAEGVVDRMSRKEASRFRRQKRKVWRNLHGIREMFRLPGALVLVDPRTELNAAREARRMGIPVVGIVDTDGDPDLCDIVIPANDDAIRSVALILDQLAEAVEEGLRLREERGISSLARREAAQESRTPRPGAAPPTPRPRTSRKLPRGGLVAPSGVVGRVPITPVEGAGQDAPSEDEASRAPDPPAADEKPSAPAPPAGEGQGQ